MFDYIRGTVISCSVGSLVLETGGVGWHLLVSAKCAAHFADKKEARVYTHLSMGSSDRPAMSLFGFYSDTERRMFQYLIDISGIGPKVAMSILSVLTPEELSLCVLSGDAKALTAAQGLGLKGAQKIILELKDKLAKGMPNSVSSLGTANPSAAVGDISEAVNALVVLGYQPQEAASAVRSVADRAKNLEDLIRLALRSMGE